MLTRFRETVRSIPQVKTNEQWENGGKTWQKNQLCYYNNDIGPMKIKYVKLYNWLRCIMTLVGTRRLAHYLKKGMEGIN